MIHANAINRNEPERFLNNSSISNATVLQLGGSCPEELKTATLIANKYNYSEINLNLGCPSSKVQSGNFGAVLMKDVNLVKNCLSEMMNVSSKEVSVKIRLGVDDSNINEGLDDFIGELSKAGVNTFYVHARIALLKGLDPKKNRSIPPLNYERVFKIKKDFNHLNVIINGGIEDFKIAKDKITTNVKETRPPNFWIGSGNNCFNLFIYPSIMVILVIFHFSKFLFLLFRQTK